MNGITEALTHVTHRVCVLMYAPPQLRNVLREVVPETAKAGLCLQMTLMLTEALDEVLPDDPSGGHGGAALGGALQAVLQQSYNRKQDMRRAAMTWVRPQPARPSAAASRGAAPGGAHGAPDTDVSAEEPSQCRRAGAGPADGGEEAIGDDHSASNDDSDEGNDMPSLRGLPSRPHSASTSHQYREPLPSALPSIHVTAGVTQGMPSTSTVGNGALGAGLSSGNGSLPHRENTEPQPSSGGGKRAARKPGSLGRTSQKAPAVANVLKGSEKGPRKVRTHVRGKGRPPKPTERKKYPAAEGAPLRSGSGGDKISNTAEKQGNSAACEVVIASERPTGRQIAGVGKVDLEQVRAQLAEIDAAMAEDDDSDG